MEGTKELSCTVYMHRPSCSYDEALTLYDTALEENKNNAEFLKRKITICKAKGQTMDAIKQLTTYLET